MQHAGPKTFNVLVRRVTQIYASHRPSSAAEGEHANVIKENQFWFPPPPLMARH